jgi:phosphoribosylanthranilate isomerase
MFNLFGPSKFDRLFDLLREDRAASVEQTAATLSLMAKLVDSVAVQATIAKAQYDAISAPTDPPRVRLMTPKHEAELERAREAEAAPGMKSVPVDTLLRDLESEFRDVKASFQ